MDFSCILLTIFWFVAGHVLLLMTDCMLLEVKKVILWQNLDPLFSNALAGMR